MMMMMMKKYASMAGEVLLLFGIFVGVAMVLNNVIVPNSGRFEQYLIDNVPIWITIMFTITAALILLVFRIKRSIVKEKYVSIWSLSKFKKMKGVDIGATTIIGIFTALLFMSMIKVSFIANTFPDYNEYMTLFMKSDTFLMVIVGVCIVGPLFEEIFFRGILLNIMRRTIPFAVAIWIQAILYGIAQPSMSIQVTGFFLAIMYALIYYRLQTIWATIWTGIVLNTFLFVSMKVGLIDLFGDFADSVLLLMAGLCLFVVLALLVSIWKGNDKLGHLKMVGGLVLWPFIFVVCYFPFLNYWNNDIMAIESISFWLGNNNVIGFVLFDVATFAIFFLVMKLIHKKNLIVVSNFSKITRKVIINISILGVGMGIWVQAFFKIPYFHDNYPQFEQLFEYLTTASLPIFILFLFVHSFYKEIFFRALVFNVLRTVQPITVSILITGVIYGGLFFLWDIPMTIYALAGALIFGLMFEWYKSIWAPIVNELFLFGTYFIMRKLDFPYSAGMIWLLAGATIVVLYMMYILFKNREIERKNTAKDEEGEYAELQLIG
jgi:membrane protease YdiL (CAAX protease family)